MRKPDEANWMHDGINGVFEHNWNENVLENVFMQF